MLAKNYTFGGMSNEEFIAYHKEKAGEEDPFSIDVINTLEILNQERLYQRTKQRLDQDSFK